MWEIIARTPEHFSSEQVFISLDIKKTGGLLGAARLFKEIERLHFSYPQLNIQWILSGNGPSAYGIYFRKHAKQTLNIGMDLVVKNKENEPGKMHTYGGFTPRRDYIAMDVSDRDAIAYFIARTPGAGILDYYLSANNCWRIADWLMRVPGNSLYDRYPMRLWTPNKKGTVSDIINIVGEARRHNRIHQGRDMYLCSDQDAARQLLWLSSNSAVTGQKGFNVYRDTGQDAAVDTITDGNSQYILEVHRTHTGKKALWYSAHMRNLETGDLTVLTEAISYDKGMDPDVALVKHNEKLYAFEVHWDKKGRKDYAWLSLFELDTGSGRLTRLKHERLRRGKAPSISIARKNNQAYIVILTTASKDASLALDVLRCDLNDPGSLTKLYSGSPGYNGVEPDIAALMVEDRLHVVEVHRSPKHKTLWTTLFEFDQEGSLLSQSQPKQYDEGENPSLSMARFTNDKSEDRTALLETHYGGNDKLWYTLTTLASWQTLSNRVSNHYSVPAEFIHGHYDTGRNPSVSLSGNSTHGVIMVEIHETKKRKLWMDSWWIAPWAKRLP